MGRRHEGRCLLVARQDELDTGSPQRLNDIEVFLARDAEDMLDALVLKRCYKQV
jgi:hypothetical protein